MHTQQPPLQSDVHLQRGPHEQSAGDEGGRQTTDVNRWWQEAITVRGTRATGGYIKHCLLLTAFLANTASLGALARIPTLAGRAVTALANTGTTASSAAIRTLAVSTAAALG